MKSYMNKDLELLKQYATQDSIITLWHALQTEYLNYEFSQSYSIPVTLSTLSTNYLVRALITKGLEYHNPQLNSLFGVQSIN